MRLVDADELNKVKFHPLPYTHIVPADLLKCQTEAYKRGWNDAIDAIMENAPTVDAVPLEDYRSMEQTVNKLTKAIADAESVKHGHWVIRDISGTYWYRITCSECGEDVTSSAPCIGFLPNAKVLWDYCPYCGAKMDEVEDE